MSREQHKEPPKPTPAPVVTLELRHLVNGMQIENPTLLPGVDPALEDADRAHKPLCGHRIKVRRTGDDLLYTLPNDLSITVPRPLSSNGKRARIEDISWPGERRWQAAFTISYARAAGSQAGVFRVHAFGEGRLEPDLLGWDPDVRPEPLLRIRATGMTYESDVPGAPGTAGPRSPLIGKARRYHWMGSNLSLYISRGRQHVAAILIDDRDAQGKAAVKWPLVLDLAVFDDGTVFVTYPEPGGSTPPREVTDEVRLQDKSLSANTVKKLGPAAPTGSRDDNLARLRALGVRVEERGARFSGYELSLAFQLLSASPLGTQLVPWIRRRQASEQARREGSTQPSNFQGPGLTLVKDLLQTGGRYDDETGEIVIPGWMRGSMQETPAAILHELAHALFHAAGGSLPGSPRAGEKNQSEPPIPPEIQRDMNLWLSRAKTQEIAVGPVDAPLAPPGVSGDAVRRWERRIRRMMSLDHELNRAFIDLHYRFSIGDPEQTGDIRGIDVADESRYLAPEQSGDAKDIDVPVRSRFRGEDLGHGFDSVHEFVASFVASSMLFQVFMAHTVQEAVATDGPWLAELYSTVWERVNGSIVALPGPNPYAPLTRVRLDVKTV